MGMGKLAKLKENDEMSSEFGQYDLANSVLCYLRPVRL